MFDFEEVPSYWKIKIDSISLGGDFSLGLCAGGCIAPVDTGSSALLAPFVEAQAIAQSVGAIQILPGIGQWMLPSCAEMSIMPDLVFNINGIDYVMEPVDYVLKVKLPILQILQLIFIENMFSKIKLE